MAAPVQACLMRIWALESSPKAFQQLAWDGQHDADEDSIRAAVSIGDFNLRVLKPLS